MTFPMSCIAVMAALLVPRLSDYDSLEVTG